MAIQFLRGICSHTAALATHVSFGTAVICPGARATISTSCPARPTAAATARAAGTRRAEWTEGGEGHGEGFWGSFGLALAGAGVLALNGQAVVRDEHLACWEQRKGAMEQERK